MRYTAADMVFLIPTKDRPNKLNDLLASIVEQDSLPGRILVIDGGKSVEDVVIKYKAQLPIEWHQCLPPGQIRQRNYGISLIKEHKLVAFLDDDLVFEPGALQAMVAMWNAVEPETAGVGFNLINVANTPPTWKERLLLIKGPRPGQVLPSGHNTAFTSLTDDIKTDWLGGGYTVWRKAILDQFSQAEVTTKWAIGEDLLFSYPIGLRYPLYACAKARVRHEHVADQAPSLERIRLAVYKTAIVSFILAYQQPALSSFAALWSIAASLLLYSVNELFHWRKERWQVICGLFNALVTALNIVAGRVTPEQAQED